MEIEIWRERDGERGMKREMKRGMEREGWRERGFEREIAWTLILVLFMQEAYYCTIKTQVLFCGHL